ncbi:NreB protein [Staphylococcus piscifermentans]|uniref:Sensor histidine kinase n=1 Tax=Staphylococcus piscifermentans TaxID=70258 RepID=A0A239TQG8_9STAP|nr:nitrate respiration regulation sensor histidine kinase NreB [Staphylococcus piscifermentans]RTX84071.1 sensor histidine kinase [Staphylococcus piscifermentans]GEP84408.1 oxygen sensor histidine kinase NreB [Staphylococcus piscifermentans]SNU99438.1 NreB protein [Staphylococcus piscifermentans]
MKSTNNRSKLQELLTQYYLNTNEKMVFLNSLGEVIALNEAAEEVFAEDNDYSQMTNAICRRCEGYSNEYDIMSCENCFLEALEIGKGSFQVFMRTKENKIQPYTASYELIDQDKGIYAFTLHNISPQIQRQERMYQRKMMQKTISAQENERKRISRELHDGIVQELINVDVELRLLKYQQDKDELIDNSKRIEGIMSRLIDDVRNLSVELRPSSLDDLGLDAAFRSYFKQFERNYGVYVDYHTNVSAQRFDNEVETVVYRVVQEALFNALKYAQVDTIEVSIQLSDETIIAEVSDRGVGFKRGDNPKGTGLGLFGMNERAEQVNGTVNIDSQIGRGTIVTLEVPITDKR